MPDVLADLQRDIERQRRLCQCLLSDIGTTHILDRQISELKTHLGRLPDLLQSQIDERYEIASQMPLIVDAEIASTEKKLQT